MARGGRDAAVAAHNNAEWCDLVCRAHGMDTAFHADAWVTATRSPPAYPDAVTLRDAVAAANLLRRIDSANGCSVKDSFASLDLAPHGFHVLFDAEWIHRPAALGAAADGLTWTVVTTADELRAWAAAHGGGDVFHPDLLADPGVAILRAAHSHGGLAAGAIGNRSRTAVGLSNLFTVSADIDEVWAGAVAALSRVFGAMPAVGYERGEHLAAAHRAGFVSVGPLRIWLRS
jgi:hypothetical protein